MHSKINEDKICFLNQLQWNAQNKYPKVNKHIDKGLISLQKISKETVIEDYITFGYC